MSYAALASITMTIVSGRPATRPFAVELSTLLLVFCLAKFVRETADLLPLFQDRDVPLAIGKCLAKA
jgi:hypothetical protein